VKRYFCPVVDSGGRGLPLAGGPLTFVEVEALRRDDDRLAIERTAGDALPADSLAMLTARRPEPFDRPRLMAVLNVTPDSFSDGGAYASVGEAVTAALRLVDEGADIVDVGGESTRPGAAEVPLADELRRVVPVVEALTARGVKLSVDTRKAAVMREAVAAGAAIINDVSGLTYDEEARAAAAELSVPVILMHMRGEPATMNVAPNYVHPALEVFDELLACIMACEAAGIARANLILDPGLCFAKSEPHNLDILRRLALFHGLGCPLLLGASRKGWTEAIHVRFRPKERLPASLAACQWGLERGVQLFRVHDVGAHRQLVDAWQALRGVS
jgi:dihydropteroate synthase